MKAVIYHNLRCSKSRATLELLNNKNVEPKIINYPEKPLSKTELKRILTLLGKRPQEIIRFDENLAKEKSLCASDARTEDEWLEMMVDNPILIERPIVVVNDQAAIGRPPETVLSII